MEFLSDAEWDEFFALVRKLISKTHMATFAAQDEMNRAANDRGETSNLMQFRQIFGR